MKRPNPWLLPALFLILSTVSVSRLPAQEISPVLVTNPPPFGTCYWLSGIPRVPYPFDPAQGLLPVWSFNGAYFVDDSALLEEMGLAAMTMMNDPLPFPGGGDPTGGGDTNFTCNTLTNFTVDYLYSTNGPALGIAPTTNPWVALTIQTTTTNASYDVFGTTNMADLAPTNLSRTNWAWLLRASGSATNFSWGETNWCERYFQLGTMDDYDGDGLTTAYEQLVSKSDPYDCPRNVYEANISSQNPNNWFKLNNDGANGLTNAIIGQTVTTLTNVGNGFWSPDMFANGNGAFSFTNTDDRLIAGDVISGGSGNDAGSMSLLFRSLNGPPSSKRYLFSQKGASSSHEFAVFVESNTAPIDPAGLKVQAGGQTVTILPSNAIVSKAWYFLAMTWDETRPDANGPEFKWYVGRVGGTLTNGSTNLTDSAVIGSISNLSIGNRQNNNGTFGSGFRSPGQGALDEIVFWNRELNASEVDEQFNTLNALFLGPSKVFDLSRWELTLPVDATNQLDNTHQPLDITTGWLNSGFKYVDPADCRQKYFYLSNGNQMVFEAPWNGADQDTNSPGAKLGSPRSELRETLANGDEFNWKPYDPETAVATNTHTLQGTCRLEHAPSKVIFGQIHADEPRPTGGAVPAVTLFHEGIGASNRIRLAVYYSPDRSVTNTGGVQTIDIVSGVNLGDWIDYELKLEATTNNAVTLYATVKTNGMLVTPQIVYMTSNPPYTNWAATNVTLYFKAGCYYPTAATNSGTARVSFFSLGVTHQP
jgi:hypothetical protein